MNTPIAGADLDYILGVWYLSWPGHRWLLVAQKAPDGRVYATGRLYYDLSGDHSTMPIRGPVEPDGDAIERLRRTVATATGHMLALCGISPLDEKVVLDEVIVCGDRAKAARLLRARPWVIPDVLAAPGEKN